MWSSLCHSAEEFGRSGWLVGLGGGNCRGEGRKLPMLIDDLIPISTSSTATTTTTITRRAKLTQTINWEARKLAKMLAQRAGRQSLRKRRYPSNLERRQNGWIGPERDRWTCAERWEWFGMEWWDEANKRKRRDMLTRWWYSGCATSKLHYPSQIRRSFGCPFYYANSVCLSSLLPIVSWELKYWEIGISACEPSADCGMHVSIS